VWGVVGWLLYIYIYMVGCYIYTDIDIYANTQYHAPLSAQPYLCKSAEMEETPDTRKSQGVISCPSSSRKGRRKPPKHASTVVVLWVLCVVLLGVVW
jgi:hypothetical protein